MRLISRVTLAWGLSHPLTPLHEGVVRLNRPLSPLHEGVVRLSHPLTRLREGVASLSRCAHAWEIIHSARSGGEAVRISSRPIISHLLSSTHLLLPVCSTKPSFSR